MNAKYDPAGQWYHALTKLGEDVGIGFGIQKNNEELVWTFLPHSKYDGIGGLCHLLGTFGLTNLELPKLKNKKKPSNVKQLVNMIKFLKKLKLPGPQWQNFIFKQIISSPTLPSHFAFSEHESLLLSKAASKHGVSINSLLITSLNNCIHEYLINKHCDRMWMVPVNLRGAIQLSNDTDNHYSYLALKMTSSESAQATHKKIKSLLYEEEHWGSWAVINLSHLLGPKYIFKIMARKMAREESWLGSFSNLGEWNITELCDQKIYFCPPVTKTCPLSAGAINWNKSIHLCMRLHPAFKNAQSLSNEILQKWRQTLVANFFN